MRRITPQRYVSDGRVSIEMDFGLIAISKRDYRLMLAVVRHATMFATGELSLRNDPPITHAAKLKAAVAAFNACPKAGRK